MIKWIKRKIFEYKDTISILDAEHIISEELEKIVDRNENFKRYVTIDKYYMNKINTIRFAFNEFRFRHFVRSMKKHPFIAVEKNYIKAIKWIKKHPTRNRKTFYLEILNVGEGEEEND